MHLRSACPWISTASLLQVVELSLPYHSLSLLFLPSISHPLHRHPTEDNYILDSDDTIRYLKNQNPNQKLESIFS